MAAGFPVKATFANGDVYSASDVNDLAGTVNLIKPTAKGDLFAGSAANTYTKLAVGTDAQVLTADSTTATGLKWATSAASSGPAFRAYLSANQTPANATWTKVAFNTESFDTDNCYNNTTTYRFTPTKAGYYQVSAAVYATSTAAAGKETYMALYFNGSTLGIASGSQTNSWTLYVHNNSQLYYFNGSTDYMEVYGYIDNAGGRTFTQPSTLFSAAWIRG